MRAVERVHALHALTLSSGDLAIDATAGNGHDTLFLARNIGPTGHVHAFDPQFAALEATRRLLRSQNLQRRVTLHLTGHEHMEATLPAGLLGHASAATFNLGYLPGGDKSLITRPASTLPALRAALRFLRPGGLLTVLAYQGHSGGKEECEAVRRELAARANSCQTEETTADRPDAPVLFAARKT